VTSQGLKRYLTYLYNVARGWNGKEVYMCCVCIKGIVLSCYLQAYIFNFFSFNGGLVWSPSSKAVLWSCILCWTLFDYHHDFFTKESRPRGAVRYRLVSGRYCPCPCIASKVDLLTYICNFCFWRLLYHPISRLWWFISSYITHLTMYYIFFTEYHSSSCWLGGARV